MVSVASAISRSNAAIVSASASAAPLVAIITPDGRLLGKTTGYGSLTASRGSALAATTYQVGLTDDADSDLKVSGLDPYPDAVTLAANSGQRQIKLVINGDDDRLDISSAAAGTRYFSSNSAVVEVTADGLLIAHGPGEAVVTIIHKFAEALIPVKITVPFTGPTSLGSTGGVVQSVDGLQVGIAPGALASDTVVSIEKLTAAQLDAPLLPSDSGWIFGGAFKLDTQGADLALPVQLAIPTNLAVGTKVSFYQTHDFVLEDGTISRGWLEVESGVVGADGMARTSSPPYGGVGGPGTYGLFATEPALINTFRGRIMLTAPLAAAAPMVAFGLAGGVAFGYGALKGYLRDHPEANRKIDGLSQEQRCFLSWAQTWADKAREGWLRQVLAVDPHPTGLYRMTAPSQNEPGFYEAFGIKAGDPMWLDVKDRVKIW